eukprot:1878717-Pyramimonas_sp.AAC.1
MSAAGACVKFQIGSRHFYGGPRQANPSPPYPSLTSPRCPGNGRAVCFTRGPPNGVVTTHRVVSRWRWGVGVAA